MQTAESHNSPQTGKVEFFKPDALPSRRQPTDFDLAYKWLRGSLPVKRNRKYLDLVRDFPCISCGKPGPSSPHHAFSGYHGMKTTDYAAIPLCDGPGSCHERTELDPTFMREGMKLLVKFNMMLLAKIYETQEEVIAGD